MEEKNKWGRPLKYTPDELYEFKLLEDLENKINGQVKFCWDKFLNNDFNKEKDLVEFITNNIDIFCKQNLNDKCISYEVDKPINKFQNFWPRWKRIDIFIQWEKWVYIIECKNVKNTTEMRYAIWQLLDYWR